MDARTQSPTPRSPSAAAPRRLGCLGGAALVAWTLAGCGGPLGVAADQSTVTGDAVPPGDAGVAGDGTAMTSTEICVYHTPDEPHCKDCCDCAPVACTDFTPCRNACKTHDFSQNKDFVQVDVPSKLGKDGDYSACVKNNATQQDCKTCCECQMGLACGDFQYCRTLCDNSYG